MVQNSIDIHVKVTGVVTNFMYDGVPDFSFRNKHVFSYVSLVRTYSCGMPRKSIEYKIHFLKIIFCVHLGVHILKIITRMEYGTTPACNNLSLKTTAPLICDQFTSSMDKSHTEITSILFPHVDVQATTSLLFVCHSPPT